MNKKEVRYWISQLTVGDPIRQVLAIRTLTGSLDDYPEAVTAVIERLTTDKQSGVRQTAAHSLGKLTKPTVDVLRALAQASACQDRFVSLAAANALIQLPAKED